jgi:hypothetical protein
MKSQRLPPYDYDVWCRYSSDVTPVYGVSELRVEVGDGVVVLSWLANYFGSFDVHRSDPVHCGRNPSLPNAPRSCSDINAILGGGTTRLTGEPIKGSGRLEYFDIAVEHGLGYEYWVVEKCGETCVGHGPVCAKVSGSQESHVAFVYPNPLMSGGWIVWNDPEESSMEVYDLSGRLVRNLLPEDCISSSSGEQLGYWDGRDNKGRPVASGVYLVTITSRNGSVGPTRKVVVIR